MKPPEEVKLEFTREWIRKAENDYRTAKYLSEADEDYAYGVTFHAQQAAEKYIKAFLVRKSGIVCQRKFLLEL